MAGTSPAMTVCGVRRMFTLADLLYSRAAVRRLRYPSTKENIMSNGSTLSLPEIEDRIAIVRDNIRQLIEQAAAFSGAEDEERNADRIAQQTEELDELVKQRDALVKK
jgi:uncharacterized small protein (DUF1192 family)